MGETSRRLTPREEARKARLERLTREMGERGYVRRDLMVTALQANVLGTLIMLPFAAALAAAFFLRHPVVEGRISLGSLFAFILAFLALIAVHELIHGAVWAIFARDHFRAISFGVMWQYLMPYCTCSEPLGRGQYLLGAAMPTLLLGFGLGAAAVGTGSMFLFLLAEGLLFGGGGDFLIMVKLLCHPSGGRETLYLDHPYECGLIVWERA